MRLRWLELRDFRSYPALRFEPDPETNLLVGENASGKTNLLEAIAYLSSLSSFRGVPDTTLIGEDAETAVVRAEVETEPHQALVEVELRRAGRRRAQVNRQNLRRNADLLGHLRTVVFLPDDLDVVKRGPHRRRDLFDQAAVQLWPGAYADQQEYAKAVRQRNALLKQAGKRVDRTTLEVWDTRLAESGARVMERRAVAMVAVLEPAREAYRALAGRPERLDVRYLSDWGGESEAVGEEGYRHRLRSALERAHPTDLERRVTTIGPHRDDPALLLDGRPTRGVASQGEQRCVALALRLGLYQAVRAEIGRRPVLLLDDVFSELDTKRAAALAGILPGGQSFVTSAREEELPLEGRRWTVAEGRVV